MTQAWLKRRHAPETLTVSAPRRASRMLPGACFLDSLHR
ncbi:hypothetical protein J2802_007639 [Paraburkholderia caribensis]|nr:hypothetical protein [Paraburkholderia caribensis]